MKAVIIGHGLAGTMAAKTLRELDLEVEVELFEEENYSYYPRPNLIEFLAGRLPYEKLFAFPESWAERQRITIHTGLKAKELLPAEKSVVDDSGVRHRYDRLLLATGSRANLPPIPGRDLDGVFVLRTLDDALAILVRLKTAGKAAVIGGGLLGLEIARALRGRGPEVTVVEFFDRLLPRQLDGAGSALLKSHMEAAGIKVRLATATEAFTGDGGRVTGLKFKNGGSEAADLVIVAAGVTPEVGPARQAGAGVNRGVVVDDLLRTSLPDVFAAGDCAEHRSRVYGIIPASFEQARAAAYNMLGRDLPYRGNVPATTLKVAGLAVTSAGEFDPEAGDYEVLTFQSPAEGIYKKLVLKGGRLAGAIWMGSRKGAQDITRLVSLGADVSKWKQELFLESFDFSVV